MGGGEVRAEGVVEEVLRELGGVDVASEVWTVSFLPLGSVQLGQLTIYQSPDISGRPLIFSI